MSEKQYFKIEYDEEWYLFDSTTISEQLVKEQAEYGYGVFANSLSPSEICDRLNNLHQENIDLDDENARLLSERIKDLEQFEECVNKAKQLREENEQLKDMVYDELDKALKVVEEIYDDYPKNNVHRLYNNLKGLKEMME